MILLAAILNPMSPVQLPQFADHSRRWQENFYVYPVISRRSGGLSIGVNLNPDTACNFDCIYCQVDRTITPRVREVDLNVLRAELAHMVEHARRTDGAGLFDEAAFASVPPALRVIRDIAFSGDGEPTTCLVFPEAVQVAADVTRAAGLDDTRIVLITDACYLTRPRVVAGLAIMDANDGEVWAKLDAGTEAYYRTINKPNYPLAHVMTNIIAAARVRPVVIQSMFLRLNGVGPSAEEITAYLGRLKDILAAGGRIAYVQVYTVARRPAESTVTSLSDEEVDRIARRVIDETGLKAESYYGIAP
jgi:wyosine [tRNA(Phe)-imidazoG37] synthetase (radical SAM superfamily)